MRAILSVSDRTGLTELARGLQELGVELYSTGGTRDALVAAGVQVAPITELTGFPELMDGRVKTLHPGVHAGILANRANFQHMEELAQQGLRAIDIVAVNLYPFEAAAAQPGIGLEEAIENIDIGGPAMLRAAAKNHASVVVMVDPSDYGRVLEELRSGGVSKATRTELAHIAFAHTAAYDSAIAAYLRRRLPAEGWPGKFAMAGTKVADLRYGENPHQSAALYYFGGGARGVAGVRQHQGIELSYNNIVDVDAAWSLVQDLRRPAAAIIKHTNPCGCAEAESLAQAYQRAYECDTTAAYGGVVGLNQECDEETAGRIAAIFVEAVVAPGFSPAALAALSQRARTRVLTVEDAPAGLEVKVVSGGFLVQTEEGRGFDRSKMRSVGRRQPQDAEWEQLLFAWQVVKHVKSNAIVLAQDLSAVGVGAGQMSRVEAVQIAVRRAGDRAIGSVLASDAFFPFPDGVEEAVRAGVTAIIQPGGSIRDAEVLAVAEAAGLAMVYTGQRHFRH